MLGSALKASGEYIEAKETLEKLLLIYDRHKINSDDYMHSRAKELLQVVNKKGLNGDRQR